MSDFWSRLVDLASGRIRGIMPAETHFAPLSTAELSGSANIAVEAIEPEPHTLETVDWPSLVPQDKVTAPLPTLHQLALNVAIVEPLQPVVREADSTLTIDETETAQFPGPMPDPLPITSPGSSDTPTPIPPLEAPSSIANNQTSRPKGSVIRRPSDQSFADEQAPYTPKTPQIVPRVGEDRPETGPPETRVSNEPHIFPGRTLAPAVDSMKSSLDGEDRDLIQRRAASSPATPSAPVVPPPIPSEPDQVTSIQPVRTVTESDSAGLELENAPEPAISSSSPTTAGPRVGVQISETDTRITPSLPPGQPAGDSDTLPPAAYPLPDLTGPPAFYTHADFPTATGSVEQPVITPPEATTDTFTAVEPAAAQPPAAQPLTSRTEPSPTTIPPTTTEAATPVTDLPTVPSPETSAETAAESQIGFVIPADTTNLRQLNAPVIPTVEPAIASMAPAEAVADKATVQSDALQRKRDRRDPLLVATDTHQTTALPDLGSHVLPLVAAAAADETVMNPVGAPLIAPDLPLQPSNEAGIPSVEPVVMPQPAPSDRQVMPLIAAPIPVDRVPPSRPTIRVTIGLVEVRTSDEPPPPPVRLRKRPKPAISLDDYLAGGSR